MELQKLQIGFIGGGRVANILLSGWKEQHINFAGVQVFDPQPEQTERLSSLYPDVKPAKSYAELVQGSNVVFLAVHPPEFSGVLDEIKNLISTDKLLVSLAPKITTEKIQKVLNCKLPVVRVIPNAPSVIGKGFNVFSLSDEVNQEWTKTIKNLFMPLGTFKQVNENQLESYATISGMGPTFIWFVFHELYQQALNTGLTDDEAKTAVDEMIKGASETLFKSGLTYKQVLDLIPSYPLKNHEEAIQSKYADTISKLYGKLKNY